MFRVGECRSGSTNLAISLPMKAVERSDGQHRHDLRPRVKSERLSHGGRDQCTEGAESENVTMRELDDVHHAEKQREAHRY
jgi:hypothetical protein